MAHTIPGLNEVFLNLEKSARNMGLVINQEKMVYMHSGKDTTLHQDLAIGNYMFKRVDNFKYLGTMVNKMNNRSVEVSGVREGGFRVFKPPPPEILKAVQKIVPNSTRLRKLLKKLLNLGRQHTKMFRKKGSKILKLHRFAIVLH